MKKIYLVPNFVTTANMFCGFYSVIVSTRGEYVYGAWAILAAGVFDMLDGRIARLAKATSQFGVEYDSLSDLISFGVAPAILLYHWALEPYERLGWLAAFLFLTCCALRLARFNVNTQIQPKNYFQGLPTPIAAGVVATFILFSQAIQWDSAAQSPVVLFLAFAISSLMVSNVQFPSFKELNWRSRATPGYLLIGVLLMILLAVKPEITLFVTLSVFIVLSLSWNLIQLVKGRSLNSVYAKRS